MIIKKYFFEIFDLPLFQKFSHSKLLRIWYVNSSIRTRKAEPLLSTLYTKQLHWLNNGVADSSNDC